MVTVVTWCNCVMRDSWGRSAFTTLTKRTCCCWNCHKESIPVRCCEMFPPWKRHTCFDPTFEPVRPRNVSSLSRSPSGFLHLIFTVHQMHTVFWLLQCVMFWHTPVVMVVFVSDWTSGQRPVSGSTRFHAYFSKSILNPSIKLPREVHLPC